MRRAEPVPTVSLAGVLFLMKSPTSPADVLIVGAGPTGLAVALSLTARGRHVAIVDNQAEGQNRSRASVIYSRTLKVLEP
jgi:2-polyprenyl-6-methoxyphenol hydroxylase-like FAD-dependent oxidoreductase